jgi:hypothetical protein
MVKEAERLERRQREESILDKSGARRPRQQAASRLLGRVIAHSSMKDLFWNYLSCVFVLCRQQRQPRQPPQD